ncbi:MAG TPA: hypothetical protein V6D18_02935 [Thermosynechococcaceae cyanobacterium]
MKDLQIPALPTRYYNPHYNSHYNKAISNGGLYRSRSDSCASEAQAFVQTLQTHVKTVTH